jgi:Bifunctional DNA primase/polymerase, N-terminal/Protein of unknown function (DUF3987)
VRSRSHPEDLAAERRQYCDRNGGFFFFFVLDVDGDEDRASLDALIERHGPLPVTFTVMTAHGRHYYYLSCIDEPPFFATVPCSRGKMAAGLDIRGRGGYAVAPPSVHPDGPVYTAVEPAAELAIAPTWLIDAAIAAGRKSGNGEARGTGPNSSEAETVAASLGKCRPKASGGFLGCCPLPGHGGGWGDAEPSLSVDTGEDGRLLLHCFGGCDELDLFAYFREAGVLDKGPEVFFGGVLNSDEEPLPLFPLPAPQAPYPMDALGPVLGPPALAIVRMVEVPAATAAQSVLGVAALAAQAHRDVMLPHGEKAPLSINLVTVAASSDRKSSADKKAMPKGSPSTGQPITPRSAHSRRKAACLPAATL